MVSWSHGWRVSHEVTAATADSFWYFHKLNWVLGPIAAWIAWVSSPIPPCLYQLCFNFCPDNMIKWSGPFFFYWTLVMVWDTTNYTNNKGPCLLKCINHLHIFLSVFYYEGICSYVSLSPSRMVGSDFDGLAAVKISSGLCVICCAHTLTPFSSYHWCNFPGCWNILLRNPVLDFPESSKQNHLVTHTLSIQWTFIEYTLWHCFTYNVSINPHKNLQMKKWVQRVQLTCQRITTNKWHAKRSILVSGALFRYH